MACSVALGTFVGGWIASARQLDTLGSAKLIITGCAIGVVCFFISMFLGCTPSELGSQPSSDL